MMNEQQIEEGIMNTITTNTEARRTAQKEARDIRNDDIIARSVEAANDPVLAEVMPVTCALVKMMANDIDQSGVMTEEEKTECRLDQQDDAAKDAPAPVKKRFVMVPVLSGGQPLPEVKVDCFSEKEANKLVWAGLSDAQKDNCEYIDWVETEDIPTTTAAKVVAEVVESVVAAAIAKDGPLLGDVQIKQEVTPVANKKAAKKAGKRTPREEIVKSAAFIALFEKAIAASRDPKRTHCKNGHTITPAHAHVGDLKRTGRYTCDPCNQDAQAKYNGAHSLL